jgi:hypothetical protein
VISIFCEFFYSILISEVKDMKSDVLRALKVKKTLNLVCRLNINNF